MFFIYLSLYVCTPTMTECPICYIKRRQWTSLVCDHEICTHCWERWQKKEVDFYQKIWPTCPICREPQKPWYRRVSTLQKIVAAGMFYYFFLRPEMPSELANPA